MGTKRCSKCGEEKPREAFSKHRRMKDGLRSYCRSCDAEYRAKYRAANREKIAKFWAEYYAANRERLVARAVAYGAENRDKKRAYARAYAAKRRLKTLDALEALPACPTDAQVISALSSVRTHDSSPICRLADNLLALALCGADEHEAKAETMAEVDDEWLAEQRRFQHKVIKEYEIEYA